MWMNKKMGIIGAGQLAKMMAVVASRFGISTILFSEKVDECAQEHVSKVVIGSFCDRQKIEEFAMMCDFVTIETENIPMETMEFLEGNFGERLMTSVQFVGMAQNRMKEKRFAASLGIPVVNYRYVRDKNDIVDFVVKYGESILKTTMNGYDGRGQYTIVLQSDVPELDEKVEYIVEQKVNFAFEISTIVTKRNDDLVFFPIPLNIHKGGILRESVVPLVYDGFSEERVQYVQYVATEYTRKIAQHVNHTGTFAVEYFVKGNGEVVFNEMAPRPHNSGHYANDLCNVSQFENHVRAIVGLPLIQPRLLCSGKMVNIVGRDIQVVEKLLDNPNLKLHLYNKKSVMEKRKLGHYNIIDY